MMTCATALGSDEPCSVVMAMMVATKVCARLFATCVGAEPFTTVVLSIIAAIAASATIVSAGKATIEATASIVASTVVASPVASAAVAAGERQQKAETREAQK